MDAREILIAAMKARGLPNPEWEADAIINRLSLAGFDLVHRDENHGPTLERAAKTVDGMVWYKHTSDAHLIANGPSDYATALRAMEVKHHG